MDHRVDEGVGTDVFAVHGGNLAAARARFKSAPEPWLDLSTGINPVPYPVPAIPPEAWQRLPEPDAIAALEAVAAQAYGVPRERVVAAAGTQAVIQVLPRVRAAKQVGIYGPTYGEHEAAWTAAGARIVALGDDELARADVVVVVNPNNPDGRRFDVAHIRRMATLQDGCAGLLVVDEAFADLLPREDSVCSDLSLRAVVLRSFGKTYGLAGLRLGFAIAPEPVAEAIRSALGPWPVSGPAIAVGRAALADRAWLDTTAGRLERDSARLDAALVRAGMAIVGGTTLFRLARVADAGMAFERLAQRGVLVRRFANRPGMLRFGIPAPGEPFALLEQRLAGLDFRSG